MEELQREIERQLASLPPDDPQERGPVLEELRHFVEALRLAQTVKEDAFEALDLASRLSTQALEDYDRALAHIERVRELLTSEAGGGEG